MDQILLELGLSDKEASVYLLLLKSPFLTAQQIADQTDFKRTNAYRLLDSLEAQGLVVTDGGPVKRFSATEPQALNKLLQDRQNQLKQTAGSLSVLMPAFRSQYSLSLDKPGVLHMAGSDGFQRLLEDMVQSKTEVLLVASNETPDDEEALKEFRKLLLERKENRVATRALFHEGPNNQQIKRLFEERGIEVRFIGKYPFMGEIALYEDNVSFTVYNPSLVVTVITNANIASTMRELFEQLWAVAKA